MPVQFQRIIDNLKAFGPQKLAIMGGVAALVLALIAVGAVYLNKPAYETLYVGLERADVNQIGLVLGEAGIEFDVASDGTTVLVAAGKTAQARMLLAEKGLPTSANAGYELFDNVGSLGLTSFMQQITRVRALEGEIARTIQTIQGIRAARVHIVMPERGNFRQQEQEPSASVVIRASNADGRRAAGAIRHLVAAAVPGLGSDKVTVLDSSGALLASGQDPSNSSLLRAFEVEQSVSSDIEANIRQALASYLGLDNFRASVRVDVNTDSKQIEETIYDPDSRVERSVQVVRSSDNASQRSGSTPTTVEQNLPEPTVAGAAEGPQSSEQSERREETTNYEINTRHVATVSNGYTVSRLSIAVVVNQARLAELLGGSPTPDQIRERVDQIKALVASATGYDEQRGDVITVSAVEFIPDDALAGSEAAGIFDMLGRQVGTLINAAAFVVVAFLLVWFGVRPMMAAVTGSGERESDGATRALPQLAGQPGVAALPDGTAGAGAQQDGSLQMAPVEEFRQRIKPPPQERLARMVDLNEERTAQILRKWAVPETA